MSRPGVGSHRFYCVTCEKNMHGDDIAPELEELFTLLHVDAGHEVVVCHTIGGRS